MATLKKYNIAGKEIGKVQVDKEFADFQVNSQLIKDYIIAIRHNARQWSANTKTRAEVKHTTKKPHKQKGTGGARHGNLVAPQFRGGGIAFGPKPKFDQHVRINQKERLAAIKGLISQKMRDGQVRVIEGTNLDKPQTGTVAKFLKACALDGRVLFLGEGKSITVSVENKEQQVSVCAEQHKNFAKSVRNIPKVNFSLAKNVNGYDLACAKELVVTEEALQELKTWLCG